jgi:hypothetical protein
MAKKVPSKSVAVVSPVTPLDPQVSSELAAFLKRAEPVFVEGRRLEENALQLLSNVKLTPVPTTSVEDVAVQDFIKSCSERKKAVESHWSITTTVHKLHRFLTGKRDVAVKALDEAATIGNRLHNAYVAEAQRKAEAERVRLQAIEDERARKQREAELAELEHQATQAEASSPELSVREVKFCNLIVDGYSPERAALTAGYKNPETKGPQLLTYSKILDGIEARQVAKALRQTAEAAAKVEVKAPVVEVVPDVQKAAGAVSRTTWKALVTDRQALIAAAVEGLVPADVLTIDEVRLNQYARSLHTAINQWPGVQAVPDTKVV